MAGAATGKEQVSFMADVWIHGVFDNKHGLVSVQEMLDD